MFIIDNSQCLNAPLRQRNAEIVNYELLYKQQLDICNDQQKEIQELQTIIDQVTEDYRMQRCFDCKQLHMDVVDNYCERCNPDFEEIEQDDDEEQLEMLQEEEADSEWKQEEQEQQEQEEQQEQSVTLGVPKQKSVEQPNYMQQVDQQDLHQSKKRKY